MRKNIDDRYNIGTWAFMGLGWWVAHLVSIAAVGYAGYALRKRKDWV